MVFGENMVYGENMILSDNMVFGENIVFSEHMVFGKNIYFVEKIWSGLVFLLLDWEVRGSLENLSFPTNKQAINGLKIEPSQFLLFNSSLD